MQAKLTLRLSDHLISQAKSYAKNHGKSLSQLVAEYFRSLETTEQKRTRHYPLRGTAYRYDRPFEPAVPIEDWEVLT
jgi:hypothetical protein